MTTNSKDQKPHWTFDWTTLSFTHHEPDKVLPIFREGSRARKIYLVTLWTLVIVSFTLGILYLVTFPWDTCYWTSDWYNTAGSFRRDYDCTGRGLTIVDMFRWILNSMF